MMRQQENIEEYREYKRNKDRNPSPERRAKTKIYSKQKAERGNLRRWQEKNKDKIKKYNQKRKTHKIHQITTEEWNECKKYFNNECAYCGLPASDHYVKYKDQYILSDLHKEHVDHNGANDISNCIPSCKSCNSSKHTFTLSEWYNETSNPNFTNERLEKILKWIKKFTK